MKTVVLTDEEIVRAELPEGYTYWSEKAQTIWLATKGIWRPFRCISNANARTHTYVMPDTE